MLRGAAFWGFFAVGTFAAAPFAAGAQQPAKVPRIGFLLPGPMAFRTHLWEAFREGLRELGYVEGQNVAIESRSAQGRFERLPDLLAELVRLNVALSVKPSVARPPRYFSGEVEEP
jgi:putative ABC transport system substrate-binding protein